MFDISILQLASMTKGTKRGSTFWLLASSLLLSGCISVGGGVGSQSRPSVSVNDPYRQLVERVRLGDWNIDFNELRRAYVKTPYYSPVGSDRNSMLLLRELSRSGDFQACADLVSQRLLPDFVSMWLHNYGYHCYKQLGDKEQSEFHEVTLERLLFANWGTGDGNSQKTAFRFISIHEAHDFFNLLGYNVLRVLKADAPVPAPYDSLEPEQTGPTGEASESTFKILLVDRSNSRPLLQWGDIEPAIHWAKSLDNQQPNQQPAEAE